MNEEARDIAYMLRKISIPNQMLSFPQHACKTASVAADLIESLSAEKEMLNAAIGQLGAIECERDMLEHNLEQVARERDAAVRGLARYRRCIDCARYDEVVVTTNTLCDDCSFGSKWQWRGVEVE